MVVAVRPPKVANLKAVNHAGEHLLVRSHRDKGPMFLQNFEVDEFSFVLCSFNFSLMHFSNFPATLKMEEAAWTEKGRARLAEMDRTKIKMDAAESNKIKTSEFLQNVEFVTTKKKLQHMPASDLKIQATLRGAKSHQNNKKDDLRSASPTRRRNGNPMRVSQSILHNTIHNASLKILNLTVTNAQSK
eukprot:gene4206-2277_t